MNGPIGFLTYIPVVKVVEERVATLLASRRSNKPKNCYFADDCPGGGFQAEEADSLRGLILRTIRQKPF